VPGTRRVSASSRALVRQTDDEAFPDEPSIVQPPTGTTKRPTTVQKKPTVTFSNPNWGTAQIKKK